MKLPYDMEEDFRKTADLLRVAHYYATELSIENGAYGNAQYEIEDWLKVLASKYGFKEEK